MSRPNEIVSKRDLLAQVWPDVVVEEGSLRFHIAALRKALGDGEDGARYITTAAGRGYCFVAPVSRSSDQDNGRDGVVASFPHCQPAWPLDRMVGRDDDVLKLSADLPPPGLSDRGRWWRRQNHGRRRRRHDLLEAFAGAVLFARSRHAERSRDGRYDGRLHAGAGFIATMLRRLIAYLRDKRMLLILDTCEHLMEAVAALAAKIFTAAPQVHILATSREALGSRVSTFTDWSRSPVRRKIRSLPRRRL